MKPSTCRFLVTILASCGALATSAIGYAQQQRSGSDAGAARMAQQLQQLMAERAKIQTENDKLKQDNQSLTKQLKQFNGERATLQQRAAQAEAAAQQDADASRTSAAANEKLRGQMQDLVTKFRETATALQAVETDRTRIGGDLSRRERDLQACTERNKKLYQLNVEVLDKMEHRGFWSGVAEREPFTKIARARLENMADDYRGRAEDVRAP